MPTGKMIDGKAFMMMIEPTSKAEAQKRAEWYRSRGSLARVIKRGNKYTVFAYNNGRK